MTVRRRGPTPLDTVASDIPGAVWPPVVSGQRAVLAGIAERLQRSQWFSPAMLARGQHAQLVALARHAALHSPQFGDRLKAAGLKPEDLGNAEGLRALPTATRTDFQREARYVDCAVLPQGHGATSETSSSGSTGEPVRVRKTAHEGMMWSAQTLRWTFWSGSDPRSRLGVARAGLPASGLHRQWGPPISTLFRTGPACAIDATTDHAEIAARFGAFDPHELMIYPGIFADLLDRIEAGTLSLPSLRCVRFLGEMVPEALRERAARVARVSSCYSTAEVGYVTLECPVSGLHHVTSETALVEVIGDDGEPVGEGETGRVVVTNLHNFATPMIRYELGDWAEVGTACPCGRGLPTLSRIRGRARNRITLPDGRTHWAISPSYYFDDAIPVRQMQMVQHSRERLELRYTADRPLDEAAEQRVRTIVADVTDPSFAVDFTHVAGRLDNPKNGKFEDFISHIG